MRRTLALGLVLAYSACGDEGKNGIGSTCGNDAECASGFCQEQQCLDPQADTDGDGLVNVVERALGTSVKAPDSDGDGLNDFDELGDFEDPRDSDGDGLIDAIESELDDADGDCVADQADPADDDPTVPGDMCDPVDPGVVVTTQVSSSDRDSYQGDVANLVGGGFVATWTEAGGAGRAGQSTRTVSFFSASGIETRRLAGLGVVSPQYHFPQSVVGLRNGDAVISSTRIDAERQAHLETQRYSGSGDALGPIIALHDSQFPGRGVQVVAHTEGNYGVVFVDPDKPVLTIRFVDGDDQLSPTIGGRNLAGEDVAFDAIGLNGGATLVVSRETLPAGGDALLLKRFDNSGEQTTADIVVQTKPTKTSALAHRGQDVGVFWIESALEGPYKVGYQLYDAALAPLGAPRYFFDEALAGCPRVLAAGFDADQQAYAAIDDDNCGGALLGWLETEARVVRLPIAAEVSADAISYNSLRATSEGTATFFYVRTPLSGDPTGVFLTRVDTTGMGTPVILE